ncbi:MAG: DUF3307 domain-containing protein [Candidatus Cloacimonetes bacterium]|nr:DUF3307 domain-containing protein [Candidatus Cloacimonadota bacterium]MBL7148666.1 DUF3307 domain-containing protein [Candidatus Cloacimonadota bacterium]
MLWKLLLAHVITDFVLQSKKMVENKATIITNLKHCVVLFVFSTIFLINVLDIQIILMLLIISVTHGIIDFLKVKLEKNNQNSKWMYFSIDQLLHLLIIMLAIFIFKNNIWITYQVKIFSIIHAVKWFKIATFFFIITFGGSYFVSLICKSFTEEFGEMAKNVSNSLVNAGKYIGILERIIISASIIAGRYELIGFLIAAKSIIRHHETGNKAFTEYFLVGTFTSFIWAAGFTYLYLAF